MSVCIENSSLGAGVLSNKLLGLYFLYSLSVASTFWCLGQFVTGCLNFSLVPRLSTSLYLDPCRQRSRKDSKLIDWLLTAPCCPVPASPQCTVWKFYLSCNSKVIKTRTLSQILKHWGEAVHRSCHRAIHSEQTKPLASDCSWEGKLHGLSPYVSPKKCQEGGEGEAQALWSTRASALGCVPILGTGHSSSWSSSMTTGTSSSAPGSASGTAVPGITQGKWSLLFYPLTVCLGAKCMLAW